VTDRRSLELFGIWFGFLIGTTLWILIGVSGAPLSLSRAVFMFGGDGVQLRCGSEGCAARFPIAAETMNRYGQRPSRSPSTRTRF
jgi:hypothetical protein